MARMLVEALLPRCRLGYGRLRVWRPWLGLEAGPGAFERLRGGVGRGSRLGLRDVERKGRVAAQLRKAVELRLDAPALLGSLFSGVLSHG